MGWQVKITENSKISVQFLVSGDFETDSDIHDEV